MGGRAKPGLCSKCKVAQRTPSRSGRLHSWCKGCIAKDRRDRYKDNPKRQKLYASIARKRDSEAHMKKIELLKSVPCADCGGRFHPVVMDFDHRDPHEKLEPVSRMVHRGLIWERIEREIAKCDVVCSNCHRIRTWIHGKRRPTGGERDRND